MYDVARGGAEDSWNYPTKSDVTSGFNWAAQLVSQSEKMAFRFAKIFFYLQPIRFASYQTEGRKLLQAHSFDFETRVEKLSVASCYRNWDKLQPDGPLGPNADFTLEP